MSETKQEQRQAEVVTTAYKRKSPDITHDPSAFAELAKTATFDTNRRKCGDCRQTKELAAFRGTHCASTPFCKGHSRVCQECAQPSTRAQCVGCTHLLCKKCVAHKQHEKCTWCKGDLCESCIESDDNVQYCDKCELGYCKSCWKHLGKTHTSKLGTFGTRVESTICVLCSSVSK